MRLLPSFKGSHSCVKTSSSSEAVWPARKRIWQAAHRGAKVTPLRDASERDDESAQNRRSGGTVCSNSPGSMDPLNAPGILKSEMRRLNSLVIRAAEEARAGWSALAVDREVFARATQALEGHPNIRIIREEVTEIPSDGVTIIATGPLTSDKLSKAISELTHERHLYFSMPFTIIDAESINMDIVSRVTVWKGRGGPSELPHG